METAKELVGRLGQALTARHRDQLAALRAAREKIDMRGVGRTETGLAAVLRLESNLQAGPVMDDAGDDEHGDEFQKVLWAMTRGSDHLVRALAAGHSAQSLYEDERCAAEFPPGFFVDRLDGEYKPRNVPSLKALDIADAAAKVPGVTSAEVVYAIDVDHLYETGRMGGEAVRVTVAWTDAFLRCSTEKRANLR